MRDEQAAAPGLHKPAAKPYPSYSRLSRYDVIWLPQGREVVALTEATASIRSAAGNITIYRKHNKPALGHPGHPSVPAPPVPAREIIRSLDV